MPERREQMDQMEPLDILLWRMSHLNSQHERENVTNFSIRGHHLRHYFDLYRGKSPYELSRDMVMHIKTSIFNDENNWYSNDVIGPSSKDQLVYETLLHDIFDTYSKLPENTLITVNPAKDYLCNICKVGDHCDLWGGEAAIEDSLYSARVLTTVIDLGFKDNVKINLNKIDLNSGSCVLTPIVLEFSLNKKYLDKGLLHFAKHHEMLHTMSDSTYGILPEFEQISEYGKFIESLGVEIK
jgi:hypothetical protein